MKKLIILYLFILLPLIVVAIEKGEYVVIWTPKPEWDATPNFQREAKLQVQAYLVGNIPTNQALGDTPFYKGTTNGLLSCYHHEQVKPELTDQVLHVLKTNAIYRLGTDEVEAEATLDPCAFLNSKGIKAGTAP